MKNFCTLLLIIFSSALYAQTTINGGTLSGTLTQSGSPYIITADVTIPKDSTLILEAGVTLDVGKSIRILSYGIFKSLGTETSPNRLTCLEDTFLGWKGLYLLAEQEQGTSVLKHTIIEHSAYNQSGDFNWKIRGYTPGGGGVLAYYTSLEIEDCIFQELRHALDVHGSYLRVKNTDFINFRANYNVGLLDSNDVVVSNCNFNKSEGYFAIARPLNRDEPNIKNCNFTYGTGGSLALGDESWADSCSFYGNENIVMNLGDFKGTVSHCTFDSSYGSSPFGTNIRVLGNGSQGTIKNCEFRNTFLHGNIAATDIFISGTPPVIVSTLFYNGMGISHAGSGELTVVNCIFQKNRQSIIGHKTTVVNCLFLDNIRNEVYDTVGSWAEANRRSSCLINQNSTFNVYNSVFWGNRNYFNQNVNHTRLKSGSTSFYNCIVEEGESSFTALDSPAFIFKGTYQDCIETTPSFSTNSATPYEFAQSCTTLPSGYNKGYRQPIAAQYGGRTRSNIWQYIQTDYQGNPRFWNDTLDIGPFEIQGLLSEIDIVKQPLSVATCIGGTVDFSSSIDGLGITANWQKSTDGTTFSILGNTDPILRINDVKSADNGTYYRQYITNQCADVAITDAAELTVKLPQNISLGDDFDMPEDSSLTLSPGSGFASYLWSTGSTSEEIDISAEDLGLGEHILSVEVTDNFGCVSESQVTITVVEVLGIVTYTNKLLVYPNPGTDIVTFEGVSKGLLTVLDVQGKKVFTGLLSGGTIDFSGLQKGLFILVLEDEHVVYRARWVKK